MFILALGDRDDVAGAVGLSAGLHHKSSFEDAITL